MYFFSNYQDDEFSSDDFEFSEKRCDDVEFSGRKYNELCICREEELIPKLNEMWNAGIITHDEYDYWCDKLYNFNLNQDAITDCCIFIGSKQYCQNMQHEIISSNH